MSDDWAICPECKSFDCGFETIKSFDGKNRFQCKECGAIVMENQILWEHREYGIDD